VFDSVLFLCLVGWFVGRCSFTVGWIDVREREKMEFEERNALEKKIACSQ
jgi:hypothetical protein